MAFLSTCDLQYLDQYCFRVQLVSLPLTFLTAACQKNNWFPSASRCRTLAPWILPIVKGLSIHFRQFPINLNFDGDVHVRSNNLCPSHIKAFGYLQAPHRGLQEAAMSHRGLQEAPHTRSLYLAANVCMEGCSCLGFLAASRGKLFCRQAHTAWPFHKSTLPRRGECHVGDYIFYAAVVTPGYSSSI